MGYAVVGVRVVDGCERLWGRGWKGFGGGSDDELSRVIVCRGVWGFRV